MKDINIYKINQEVWLYRTDIKGFTKGYVTGFTKKRISAYNYTLDRVGHYKPEHVKNIQEKLLCKQKQN